MPTAPSHARHPRPERLRPVARTPREPLAPRIATVVGQTIDRQPLVQWRGVDPVPARFLYPLRLNDFFSPGGGGREVLLIFDDGQPDRPIVVGILQSEAAAAEAPGTNGRPASMPPVERLLLEALGELVLKCGEGSITLRKDGKIVLRGTHLLSRASGPIRIKGGHVEIN